MLPERLRPTDTFPSPACKFTPDDSPNIKPVLPYAESGKFTSGVKEPSATGKFV